MNYISLHHKFVISLSFVLVPFMSNGQKCTTQKWPHVNVTKLKMVKMKSKRIDSLVDTKWCDKQKGERLAFILG